MTLPPLQTKKSMPRLQGLPKATQPGSDRVNLSSLDTQSGVILKFCSAFERIWSSKRRNGGSTLWHSQGVGACTAPVACPPHPPGESFGNCQKSRSQTYLYIWEPFLGPLISHLCAATMAGVLLYCGVRPSPSVRYSAACSYTLSDYSHLFEPNKVIMSIPVLQMKMKKQRLKK